MKRPPLRSFQSENFKAIRDSGRVEFGWLTAFIGNNGTGKSSLVEALETFRDIVLDGVDSAFRRWRGFEHVWNMAGKRKLLERVGRRPGYDRPLKYRFDWELVGKRLLGQQSITQGPGGNSLFIQQERLHQRRADRIERWTRTDAGQVKFEEQSSAGKPQDSAHLPRLGDGESMLRQFAWESFERWQFLMLNPERMGQPTPQQRAASVVKLTRDGANVAEYLNDVRSRDSSVFEGILDAVRFVLPYATDVQPSLTSELGREFYLKMREQDFEVPGWLLSTGTLRVLALLAVLRHPDPPPLLVVEELENGLDPRTLNMVVEEIRTATTAGRTQVIVTTHSPYLLDLLDLSQIVVVEGEDGETVFRRPDEKGLAEWSKSFSPGRLYTMGRLTGDER